MGTEFAAAFPKIAGRLDLGGFEIRDPYVERLLQGTAFLAARIQMKLDAEFPRFSHRLLEMLYPHYLAPTPAMLVAQFQPVLADANLAAGGRRAPRDSTARSFRQERPRDEMRVLTAQPVTLWPIELVEASYFFAADLPLSRLPLAERCKGGFASSCAAPRVCVSRRQRSTACASISVVPTRP
jgi:type VI secretion system protein ImpG